MTIRNLRTTAVFQHTRLALLMLTFLLTGAGEVRSQSTTIDFDEFNLGTAGYLSQPIVVDRIVEDRNEEGALLSTTTFGTFPSHGVGFSNTYTNSVAWGPSWQGFAISNHINTTEGGFGNQYSAITGGGFNDTKYAVGFGSSMAKQLAYSPEQLTQLPSIYLPTNSIASSMLVTNTTYAALDMLEGSTFSKKFGGTTGNDPDFLSLYIYGIDASGSVLAPIEFFLADFRGENNTILNQWTEVDLSPLEDARSLHFVFDSSDIGLFGINTPVYFAMDNFVITAVPEPSSIVLCSLLAASVYARRRFFFSTTDSTEYTDEEI